MQKPSKTYGFYVITFIQKVLTYYLFFYQKKMISPLLRRI